MTSLPQYYEKGQHLQIPTESNAENGTISKSKIPYNNPMFDRLGCAIKNLGEHGATNERDTCDDAEGPENTVPGKMAGPQGEEDNAEGAEAEN